MTGAARRRPRRDSNRRGRPRRAGTEGPRRRTEMTDNSQCTEITLLLRVAADRVEQAVDALIDYMQVFEKEKA